MFQGCFKEFSRKLLFHNSLGVTKNIEECFEVVSRIFHRSLKGISRKFQRWFSQVLAALQECFKKISRKLKSVLSASMMFHVCFKVFQGCLICPSWLSEPCFWVFQGCFKQFLRKLEEFF